MYMGPLDSTSGWAMLMEEGRKLFQERLCQQGMAATAIGRTPSWTGWKCSCTARGGRCSRTGWPLTIWSAGQRAGCGNCLPSRPAAGRWTSWWPCGRSGSGRPRPCAKAGCPGAPGEEKFQLRFDFWRKCSLNKSKIGMTSHFKNKNSKPVSHPKNTWVTFYYKQSLSDKPLQNHPPMR